MDQHCAYNFFFLVGHMRKILSKQLWLVCVHMEAHKNSIFHVDHMLQPTCTHHIWTKLLLVGARCCVGIGHLSAFKTQCLNWFSFYFTLHTDTTKCSFCLSLTYTNTHWLLPHNNNIEFNQNHFYLVQKLRQTDMHQILNRKEKWTTKSRASIWW